MRTTLTLDPDVAERLNQEMKSQGLKMKTIINQALRKGLRMNESAVDEPFKVEAHNLGIRPGIDQDRLNQLVDELQSADFVQGQSY